MFECCTLWLLNARQAVEGLEAELDAAAQAKAAREAQLASVTNAARRQADAARAALTGGQAQVERLEGLTVALRDSLGVQGNAALAGLDRTQRRALVESFQELRAQLDAAQASKAEGG